MTSPPTDPIDLILLCSGLWAVGVEPQPELSFIPEFLASSRWKRRLILRSIMQKMLPMVVGFLRERGLDPGVDLSELDEVFRVANRILYRSIEPTVAALSQSGVPVLLLKGGGLHLTAYRWRTGVPRVMSDLDLLVKHRDVSATIQTLEQCGFRQGWMDRATVSFRPVKHQSWPIDLTPLAPGEPQPDHYELQVFGKFVAVPELAGCTRRANRFLKVKDFHVTTFGGEAWLPVKCDVHFNVSRGIDAEDAWHDARSIRMPEGAPALVQSPGDALWFLAARLYHEVRETGGLLRQFIDVLALIHASRECMDWDRVVAMGQKYSVLPSLYHVLVHARDLLGELVPPRVIQDCSPAHAGMSAERDWGDFMPKLLASKGRKVRTLRVALDC